MVIPDIETPAGPPRGAPEAMGPGAEDRKARLRTLLNEIVNFSADALFNDHGRLRKLRTEYDTLLLEQIIEFLKLTERNTDSVLTIQNTRDAIEKRFMKALDRTDLTVKEFLFLTEMNSKRIDRLRQGLLAQKQAIEQRSKHYDPSGPR